MRAVGSNWKAQPTISVFCVLIPFFHPFFRKNGIPGGLLERSGVECIVLQEEQDDMQDYVKCYLSVATQNYLMETVLCTKC